MKKRLFLLITVIAMSLSACGLEPEPAVYEVDKELQEQQAEYEQACSLIEIGKLAEAESLLVGLDRIEEAEDKLLEIEQIKLKLELQNKCAGTWINSDFSGMDIVLSPDGSGSFYDGQGDVKFSFFPSVTGISTDCEALHDLKLGSDGEVRKLTTDDLVFFSESDINANAKPDRIEITTDNWVEYFEIVTECFAESWRPNGDLDYYSEILYFSPKAEIKDRLSSFHGFRVSFAVNYDRVMYGVMVDPETFMPPDKRVDPYKLGNTDGECELNNQTLQRIDTGNILYSDGFAHQSLRDAEYVRYFRYYDVAENIVVKNVSGCIFLNP